MNYTSIKKFVHRSVAVMLIAILVTMPLFTATVTVRATGQIVSTSTQILSRETRVAGEFLSQFTTLFTGVAVHWDWDNTYQLYFDGGWESYIMLDSVEDVPYIYWSWERQGFFNAEGNQIYDTAYIDGIWVRTGFRLYDLEDNGVPIIVISSSQWAANGHWPYHIYRYVNGEYLYMDTLWNTAGFYRDSNGRVILIQSNHGDTAAYFISFNNTILTQEYIGSWEWDESPAVNLNQLLSIPRMTGLENDIRQAVLAGEFDNVSSGTGDFATNSCELGRLFEQGSSVYNHDLATLSARLSKHVYDNNNRDIVRKLESLDMRNIYTGTRGYTGLDNVTFAFAWREIIVNGEPKNLIVVAVRGSYDTDEWISNFGVGNEWYNIVGINGGGYHVGFTFGWVALWNALHEYIWDNHLIGVTRENLFLVTGHSRGGAIANLLAVTLNHDPNYDFMSSSTNVFAYTFASPNVSNSPSSVRRRENNIFNIINTRDIVTSVPPFLAGRAAGRYGIDLTFTEGVRRNILANHCMENLYLTWMLSNPANNFINPPANHNNMAARAAPIRLHTFNSPVDIRAYDGRGYLIGEITNNIARNTEQGNALVFVSDGVKHLIAQPDDELTIKMHATGYGLLTYTIEIIDMFYDTPAITTTFENVALYPGREFVSEIESDTANIRLLVFGDGEFVGAIESDGTEVPFRQTNSRVVSEPESDSAEAQIEQTVLARWLTDIREFFAEDELRIVVLTGVVLILLLIIILSIRHYRKSKRLKRRMAARRPGYEEPTHRPKQYKPYDDE